MRWRTRESGEVEAHAANFLLNLRFNIPGGRWRFVCRPWWSRDRPLMIASRDLDAAKVEAREAVRARLIGALEALDAEIAPD